MTDPDTTPGRPRSEQWWVINGDCLMTMLERAADGEDLELLYLEYISQCETETVDGDE